MSEFQTKLNSVPSGGFLTDRDNDKKPTCSPTFTSPPAAPS